MQLEKHDLYEEAGIQQGVVPVHMGFGNFIPDDKNGKLSRGTITTGDVVAHLDEPEMALGIENQLDALTAIDKLIAASAVKIHVMQIPVFPGTDFSDMDELMHGIQARGIEPQLILMVPSGDPTNSQDEDVVAKTLGAGVQIAIRNKIPGVSSTSLEKWMSGEAEKTDADFDIAIAQIAKLHARVHNEQKMEENGVKSWNVEFLRPGEMVTFTKLERAWKAVKAMNDAIGKPFFKVLVDSAHCGDSGEDVGATQKLLKQMIDAGDVNMVHVSVPTTRGADVSDITGMRPAVTATATTSKIRLLVDEVFDPNDPVLDGLRKAKFGFGVDTGLGMNTTEVLAANLANTRLRALAALKMQKFNAGQTA